MDSRLVLMCAIVVKARASMMSGQGQGPAHGAML